MNITEIRVKLTMDRQAKLKGFCSVTFDKAFVIRDIKIIEGTQGPFVAMPSRKLADRCPGCGSKNYLSANYCGQCGGKLDSDRATRDQNGRQKLHADLAHPINSACRIELHRAVVRAYAKEVERSDSGDYEPVSFDDLDDVSESLDDAYLAQLSRRDAARKALREAGQTRSRLTSAGEGALEASNE